MSYLETLLVTPSVNIYCGMVVDHEFRAMLKKKWSCFTLPVCVCVPTGTEEYHEIPDALRCELWTLDLSRTHQEFYQNNR
jgi:hypothetical protein